MSEKITFQELVEAVSSETGQSDTFTHDFLKDLVQFINVGLEADGKVNLSGFGKFELKRMDEREGYNPQTGERMTIPAHNKIIFKPYKNLRERVNARYGHLKAELIEEEAEKSTGKNTKTPAAKPSEPRSSEKPADEAEKAGYPYDEFTTRRMAKGARWIIAASALLLFSSIAFAGYRLISSNDTPQKKSPVTEGRSEETINKNANHRSAAVPGKKKQEPSSAAPPASAGRHTAQLNLPDKYTVKRGDDLWSLAGDYYRDHKVWPWIYNENDQLITNPDSIYVGQSLHFPVPEGRPGAYTHDDSVSIALAYVETYKIYRDLDRQRAHQYLAAAKKYEQDVLQISDIEPDAKGMSASAAREP